MRNRREQYSQMWIRSSGVQSLFAGRIFHPQRGGCHRRFGSCRNALDHDKRMDVPGQCHCSKLCAKLSEWIFRRIARVYGFTLFPPMPPDPADASRRVPMPSAEVFQHIKDNPDTLVALAPEGRDFPGGVLGMPPAGSGKFLLELSRRLGPVYPVGIFEEGGALHLRFGAPFDLCSIIRESALDPDSASRVVMEHIASLLPGHLAGEFQSPQEMPSTGSQA